MDQRFGVVVICPSVRDAHIDVVLERGLRKSLRVVDLSAFQSKDGTQDHDETHGTPLNYWTVRVPVVDAVALLAAIGADATLVFDQGPIWPSFATVGPNGVK